MKLITWIVLLVFARSPWPQKADSLINPPLMQQAESILRFDKSTLDIGTLTEDDAPQAYRFTGRNISKEAVTVTKVRTTCGCTAAELPAGKILPGETATIVLTYHPKNHPGTIDTDAFVYLSCSEKHPVARLTLTGNVLPGADEWARYPYAMGRLRLKQNRMEFQEVMPGKRPSERILCGNSGDKPLRLSEPEVIQPGSEADIVVTVDASLIPAGKEKTFTFPIIIEGVDARPSDRTLNIKVNYTK